MDIGLKYKNQEHIFDIVEREGVPYLCYPLLEKTGIVKHAFSTRLGGVSTGCFTSMNISTSRGDDPFAVRENVRRMAKAIGVNAEDFTYTQQMHTTNVAVVREEDKGRQFLNTDGLITDVPGICLVTFYADCVPLYFVDPVKRVIALSHSGWRGTVKRMGLVTIEKMKETFGCEPENIVAAIGPSICQDCYEVSEDVIDEFKKVFDAGQYEELFYEKENRKFQLNLWKANEIILTEAGIRRENLAVTNVCTHCNPELLFSHRSCGTKRGNLSAFLALR